MNFWETTCINTLQFLFQIFTLFNPISNIRGTYKLNCILCNRKPVIKFYYQQILRKICRVVTWTWSNNSQWMWKMIVDEKGEVHKSSHSQMFFKRGVLKNSTIFIGKHLRWSLCLIKLQACNFIKKRLQHIFFSMDIVKFLRTAFL